MATFGIVMENGMLLYWSGGKDSAMALHEIRQSGQYEIVALLTTVAEQYKRISHHGRSLSQRIATANLIAAR